MYPNLIIEMRRQNISQKSFASTLGMSEKTLSNKMAGRTDWTLGECRNAANVLGRTDIDVLFKFEKRVEA